jgi:hypothetical protein
MRDVAACIFKVGSCALSFDALLPFSGAYLPSRSRLREASCFSCVHPFDLHAFKHFPVCPPLQQSSSTMSSSFQNSTLSDFKPMLDDALARYKRTTRNDLLTLWLASEMQTCDSFDAVLDILRDQAKAFERSDDQRLMKWIDPLAHVLHTFSDALDGVSSVLIKNPLHDNLTNFNSLF